MAVIIPALPARNFTIIPNAWLRDPRLSLKARGLLVYLMSHAEGYRCSHAQMVRDCADGKDAVRNARDELLEVGYLRKLGTRSGTGRFAEDDYTIQAPPAPTAADLGGKPDRDGKPAGEGTDPRGKPASDGKPASVGKTASGNPPHRRPPGEETTSGEDDAHAGAPTLELVTDTPEDDPRKVLERRTQAVARQVHEEVTHRGVPFMGLRNVARHALQYAPPGHPDGYTDEQVIAAMTALWSGGRSITVAATTAQLDGRSTRTAPAAAPPASAPADAYSRGFTPRA